MQTLESHTGSRREQVYVTYPDGREVAGNLSVNNQGYYLASDKISVDTGKYIPGVYRNNPYKVYKSEYVLAPFILAGDRRQRVSYYGNSYTIDESGTIGDWAYGALYNTSRLPSILQNVSNVEAEALAKAFSKVTKGQVNLGEDLGEIRETLRFLRHPFQQARDYLLSNNLRNLGVFNRILHYLKTGSWVEKGGTTFRGKKAALVASAAWLEFRYGFLPLITTIQGLMKMYSEKEEALNTTKIRTVHGKVDKVYKDLFSKDAGLTVSKSWLDCRYTDEISGTAGVHFRMNEKLSELDKLGLSARFAPETAWQLTRASFVVDWWLGVSDWLGSFRYTPAANILGAYSGIKVNRILSVGFKSRWWDTFPGGNLVDYGDVISVRTTYYERTVRTLPPLLPQLKLDFRSVNHLVDGLALILQSFLPKLKR